jgi:hypothetical protein
MKFRDYINESQTADIAAKVVLKKLRCRECDSSDLIMKKKGKQHQPWCNDCKEFVQFYEKK